MLFRRSADRRGHKLRANQTFGAFTQPYALARRVLGSDGLTEVDVKDRLFKIRADGSRAKTIEYLLITGGIAFATMAVLIGLGKELNMLLAS